MGNERIITLPSVKNMRDLGGIKTADGRTIGQHRLLRSAALSRLMPTDALALVRTYKVKKILDLRTETEVMEAPDAVPHGVNYLSVPVFTQAMVGISHEGETDAGLLRSRKKGLLENLFDMSDLYRNIMEDPRCIRNFETIVKEIMAEKNGAVLWHCTAGKDRCGMTTAMILSILGVSEEEILEDFLLTNLAFRPNLEQMPEKYRAYMAARPEYMEAVFEVIHERYGGWESFIRKELKISEKKENEFRERILE